MARRPTIDTTEQGPQHVLPGAERITDAELARRRTDAPLRPTVPQSRPGGLFGTPEPEQPPLPLAPKSYPEAG